MQYKYVYKGEVYVFYANALWTSEKGHTLGAETFFSFGAENFDDFFPEKKNISRRA